MGRGRDPRFAPATAAAGLLAILLWLAPGACAASAPAATRPAENADKIVRKPHEAVTFRVEGPAGAAEGRSYLIAQVLWNGRPVFAPPNMQLDGNTGAFSWTPQVSQAGDYEVAFLVRQPPRPSRRVVRRITIEAPPVTSDRGELGGLLRRWFHEGTAAGNVGDFYDNRDRGHSHLDMGKFPQLDKVEYPEPLKERRLDWGLQAQFLFRHVTIGNSSTAAGPAEGGSNSRRAVLSPQTAQVLYRQYVGNHLYVYPEHRDHDPGCNGRGGYGDLLPANVPYLITSQGSSGSDQPFVNAVACTLAAFRPEVKKRLIETGLLMPTVQMILRACNKNVKYLGDYLTGKAHPTAFEGANVDPLAMVKMAHEITSDAIPPMVQLAVVEEDEAVPGRDYFDVAWPEKLFDTPAAIARIVRSVKCTRRMVVSARSSYEANGRPLTYHWAVLRGDAERIKIRPMDEKGSQVELLVPFHERRPIRPGAELESCRVDIGAFVRNGKYYSAPGFVCLCSLADEARTYDADGRVLEVAYDYGDSTIGYPTDNVREGRYDVADWQGLLNLLRDDAMGLGAELLRKRLAGPALLVCRDVARELQVALAKEAGPQQDCDRAEAALKDARAAADAARKQIDAARKAPQTDGTDAAKAALDAAETRLKELQDAQKEAEKQLNEARRKLREARAPAHTVLTKKQPRLAGGESVKQRLEKELNAIKSDPGLYCDHPEAIRNLEEACRDEKRKKAYLAAREELVKLGLLADDGKGWWRLAPQRPGKGQPAERLTTYERNRLEWFHIAVLQDLVYEGMLDMTFRRNFVQPFLSAPKNWRDVYHYDAQGRPVGWTRYDKGEKKDFTANGEMVEKADALGRPVEACPVQYVVDRDTQGRPREIKYMALPATVRYEYDSDSDRVGHVKKD